MVLTIKRLAFVYLFVNIFFQGNKGQGDKKHKNIEATENGIDSHGFNLAQNRGRSIANRRKDSFSFLLTTVRWGITLRAWGGFVLMAQGEPLNKLVPPSRL